MVFPSPYPSLLRDDAALDLALNESVAEARSRLSPSSSLAGMALSIFCLGKAGAGPLFRHAGIRSLEMHFSASVLKVAAMYAAHELRRSCNMLAAASAAKTQADLFAELRRSLDPQIEPVVPSLRIRSLPPAKRLPKYEQIFVPAPLGGGGWSLAFAPRFGKAMREMIVASDGRASGTCITSLGYSWINGTLRSGGFFAPPATGIWLAGTYAGLLPAVSVPTVNGRSAAATTCFHMANLLAHMARGTLVDDSSSKDMLSLLGDAAKNRHSAIDWAAQGLPKQPYTVTHSKIGIGPLKGGGVILSEATILTHGPSGNRFAVIWQNVLDRRPLKAAVSAIVARTIELFLANPAGAKAASGNHKGAASLSSPMSAYA